MPKFLEPVSYYNYNDTLHRLSEVGTVEWIFDEEFNYNRFFAPMSESEFAVFLKSLQNGKKEVTLFSRFVQSNFYWTVQTSPYLPTFWKVICDSSNVFFLQLKFTQSGVTATREIIPSTYFEPWRFNFITKNI